MTAHATLIGIARKSKSHAPMETLDQVQVSTELGVDGDYRGKLRRRQVTILAEEGWNAAINEISKPDLPWTTRRANLFVRGIDLPREKGSKLVIGSVTFEITGETDPCHRMDDAAPGLKDAMTPDWRGGVTCRVIESGELAIGDQVTIPVA
ncbi:MULTISPECIES: MOSC domain-containing protein [Thalassospira]|uniref:MOSC domain-containing protein n=1 Tax=Thalassospira povalilytica TaxID=732237 RepID=A0ABX4R855_9PROT|nr:MULTISPECIES: MOSC domain-containing protein [Thalassospira]KZB59019.1 molybdenum cofactor biosysynthesis protein [Thalassospira sp. MCCC 1A02491]PKR49319.1 MOSC domain-containing protein [Thalassospira povalilytica]